jgi:hypothetical protein
MLLPCWSGAPLLGRVEFDSLGREELLQFRQIFLRHGGLHALLRGGSTGPISFAYEEPDRPNSH